MKDYFKFLLSSFLSLSAILALAHYGFHPETVIYITVGVMLFYKQFFQVPSYILWLVFLYLWWRFVKNTFPYPPHAMDIDRAIQGAWMLAGIILLNPLCYVAVRGFFYLLNKYFENKLAKKHLQPQNAKAVELSKSNITKLRRYWAIWFGIISLSGEVLIKVAEVILAIPKHPYENYAAPYPLVVAWFFATYMKQRKRSSMESREE